MGMNVATWPQCPALSTQTRAAVVTIGIAEPFSLIADKAMSLCEAAMRMVMEVRQMSDLSSFPITKRWPAQFPDRLQLYSLPTPNGVKVSIMLEETGLPYEAHLIDITKNESKSSGNP